MQNFQKYGFTELTSEQISGLQALNPQLEPLCHRYQGMGWVDLVVKCNQKYKIVSMGGENGYTAERHEKEYAALNDTNFVSAETLCDQLSGTEYTEVVSQKEYDGATVQEVITKKV